MDHNYPFLENFGLNFRASHPWQNYQLTVNQPIIFSSIVEAFSSVQLHAKTFSVVQFGAKNEPNGQWETWSAVLWIGHVQKQQQFL